MGHPKITARDGLHLEPVFVADEHLAPLVVTVVKGVYAIEQGRLVPSAPRALDLEGSYNGDPAKNSIKYESESAFFKPNTDVVMIGAARAQSANTRELDVGLKVGPVQKVVHVSGDRFWVKTGGSVIATRAQPFELVPLVYERAFGGWDKAHKDERNWTFDARNPVGCGFGDPLRYVEEGKVPMPNLEDPNHLIKRYGDRPPPAGFGFVSPNWEPRARHAGTYDEAWHKERKPRLPKDFDRRFFNAASPGLIATGYLRGDEDVVVVNVATVSPLRFKLPAISPPTCRVGLRDNKSVILRTNLDTVIVDAEEMRVSLLWRAFAPVPNGPHDVLAVEILDSRAPQRATA